MKVGCGWLTHCLPRTYVVATTATGMAAVYR